jgi:hypothetical protein
MILDDHDVHDDWNTSELWIERMRAQPWWDRRITSALSTYWIYQHLGNLSPAELEADKLLQRVMAAEDAAAVLHEFARAAEHEGGGSLWSFARDLGSTRLVVLDGREGRVLSEGRREMLDEQEWWWFEKQVSGNFDHLLIANTLPVLLPPNFHYLEAWNEAVCAGAWGKVVARWGERLREALDLEHWAAFHDSFHRLIALVGEVATGQHGTPPVTIAFLGGDVHHAYLHEATFRSTEGVRSALYQIVCSPFRHPLDRRERVVLIAARRSRLLGWIIRRLAQAARVREPGIRWRLRAEPTFDNQLALLHLDGPRSSLRIERTHPGESVPHLETALEAQLA